jgi:glutamate-5-semialdehyde dehydrogenase
MANGIQHDLPTYCRHVAEAARVASYQLASLSAEKKNQWLLASANALLDREKDLLQANKLDLSVAVEHQLSPAQVDRLRLNTERIQEIAIGLRQVAALPDPIGEVLEGSVRPNGLKIQKVRVPLGVVFFIYESRPNVTADAAAICVKSGNSVILRGGKEAAHSSQAIVGILRQIAIESGIPQGAVQLVETADRDAIDHFLKLNEFIDVAIPRGGEPLIRRVAAAARMPVIKHFDGNCHVYVDAAADIDMAVRILVNSKAQRMGVCNACESLLVHRSIAATFLPAAQAALEPFGIEYRTDATASTLLRGAIPATDADWSTEYLGPILSVRVVDSLEQATDHIQRYGSKHTDAIVTNDLAAANRFVAMVDSAAVMVNASTRFNDGGQFGMGAEIGISTDKFHARGPCGLNELTSYKYVVFGEGHVRT